MEKSNIIRYILRHLNNRELEVVSQKLEIESLVSLYNNYIKQIKSMLMNCEISIGEIIIYIEKLQNGDNYENIDFNHLVLIKHKIKIFEIFEYLINNESFKALSSIRETITNYKCRYNYPHSNLCDYTKFVEDIKKCSKLIFMKNQEEIKGYMYSISPESLSKQDLINFIENLSFNSIGQIYKSNKNLYDVLDSLMKKQINECKYHNTTNLTYTFFNDHVCPKTLIPYKLIFSLENYNEEIQNIIFSNSMKYFAVILKSNSIIIYKLYCEKPSNIRNKQSTVEIILVNSILNPHSSMITSLQWKNDDSCILTSSKDKMIKIFDPFRGTCLLIIDKNRDMVSSAIFAGNHTKIISSCLDYKISLWDLSGECNFSINLIGLTVSELHFSALYNYFIIISATTNSILFYDFETREEIYNLPMNDVIISCATSKLDDGGYLLINSSKATPVLNLINLKSCTQIERKYFGHRQERFSNKCNFGGQSENFLLCGSEDARIYIWNRHHSIPISSIKVHSAPVNSVIWASNEFKDFLISCSDDHTIKFISNEKLDKVQEVIEIKEEFTGNTLNNIN